MGNGSLSGNLTIIFIKFDDYGCHRNSPACYKLVQSVLKIGSVLAERVGLGEVGGS